MSKVLITSNRLSRNRGVVTTTASNVNDVAKLMRWRNRLNTEHIFHAVRESLNG